MDRRDFLKSALLSGGALLLSDWKEAFARGTQDPRAGKVWQGWKEGEFQIHFIYTGVGESMFLIFPDGTTMLLDCGDFDAAARGEKAVPILPNSDRHAGEWIARYVTRVNPAITDVDYMMLTHYHNDHAGSDQFYAEKIIRDGEEYALSGFSQTAETLHDEEIKEFALSGLSKVRDEVLERLFTPEEIVEIKKRRKAHVDAENARRDAADEEERKQLEQEAALKLELRKKAEEEKRREWYRKRRRSRQRNKLKSDEGINLKQY